ncbi:transposase [Streptomyces sp. NPDC057021]|uniref:transposase n=1 Tax=Streptomyces sp. NPDC057021 TaxID=3346003 RepID=UPI0036281EC3
MRFATTRAGACGSTAPRSRSSAHVRAVPRPAAGAATGRDLTGSELPAWMERVEHDDLPALHSLVNGLRRDQDAVIVSLSSSWNSGQVEGQDTRVKRIKRGGYGRANSDLLSIRILHRS